MNTYKPKHTKKNKKALIVSFVMAMIVAVCTTTAINAKQLDASVEFSESLTEAFAEISTEAPTEVPTTIEPTTVEPTTVEPTTVEPTAVEPTTVEPTTVEPTTVAPTEAPTEVPAEVTEEPVEVEHQDALIPIDNPDYTYVGCKFNLADSDREVLRHVIMGEAGGEGFTGCAILAQTIRDNWLRGGYSSAEAVRTSCRYYGWNPGTNSDVEAAINYIFDEGQNAVQHRICFMYNPVLCESGWHESQNYITTYGDVRYFDAW